MATKSEQFSTGRAALQTDELPEAIQRGIDELLRIPGVTATTALQWNKSYIAIALDLQVDLPARGPVGGLDIRAQEPILLLLHKRDYPLVAPLAYSDRKDFPADRLAHLNPVPFGTPASFCLHRGNINDWFSEHSLADFIFRIQAWLRDAASNRLMRQSDRFEHTRLSMPLGTISFSATALEEMLASDWQTNQNSAGRRYFLFTLNSSEQRAWKETFLIQTNLFLPAAPSQDLLEFMSQLNELLDSEDKASKKGVGLVLYGPPKPVSRYFSRLPCSFGELLDLTSELQIPLEQHLREYIGSGSHLLKGIPVIIAVTRPQPLIGTTSTIEWLGFNLLADVDSGEEISRESKVFSMGHREPLTPSFAGALSGAVYPDALLRPIILGIGAVGSKLSLHLGKSGITDQTLVDNASITPHHLVRHGLLSGYLGRNKAEAVALELSTLFSTNKEDLGVKGIAGTVLDVLNNEELLTDRTLLIDATASSGVQNILSDSALLPKHLRVCRCEIGDQGHLGIFSYEGENRNPRLDDLQVYLYDLGCSDPSVRRWLARHRDEIEQLRGPALEEIGLGIGCSSATMRLADDVVTAHTTQFSMRMKRLPATGGLLQLSIIDDERSGIFETRVFPVAPTQTIASGGAGQWTTRILQPAVQTIANEMRRAGSLETGGLLIGLVNKKRRIIYVTRALPASADSIGSRTLFRRGTKNYLAEIESIEQQTAGLLGYVGEWHTHPIGALVPSTTDIAATREIGRALRATDLPVHIVIAGPSGIASYVYG